MSTPTSTPLQPFIPTIHAGIIPNLTPAEPATTLPGAAATMINPPHATTDNAAAMGVAAAALVLGTFSTLAWVAFAVVFWRRQRERRARCREKVQWVKWEEGSVGASYEGGKKVLEV